MKKYNIDINEDESKDDIILSLIAITDTIKNFNANEDDMKSKFISYLCKASDKKNFLQTLQKKEFIKIIFHQYSDNKFIPKIPKSQIQNKLPNSIIKNSNFIYKSKIQNNAIISKIHTDSYNKGQCNSRMQSKFSKLIETQKKNLADCENLPFKNRYFCKNNFNNGK